MDGLAEVPAMIEGDRVAKDLGAIFDAHLRQSFSTSTDVSATMAARAPEPCLNPSRVQIIARSMPVGQVALYDWPQLYQFAPTPSRRTRAI
jgi:hypothetical protein